MVDRHEIKALSVGSWPWGACPDGSGTPLGRPADPGTSLGRPADPGSGCVGVVWGA